MNSLTDQLRQKGVAKVDRMFGPDTVDRWNEATSNILNAQAERSYVSASDLHRAGVLAEIFSPAVRNAIRQISPTAVIYHCHIYEIAANRDKSHIHSGHFAGWHADDECAPLYHKGDLGFISMFIHMTDVETPSNGAFELRPTSPVEPLKHGQPSIHLLGPAGTGFFFHRSFFHRASPNTSDVRRRVFKLSIQDRGLPHERRNLPEFNAVHEALRNDDPFLHQLFDTDNQDLNWQLPEVPGAADFDSYVPAPNSTVALPLPGRLKAMLGTKKLAA